MTKNVFERWVLTLSIAALSFNVFAVDQSNNTRHDIVAATQSRDSKLDIPIPDIPYTKFVLKNGLTLLVHEDHKAPIVAVNTWYHVGSKNEQQGKTGFAHLFEHLMFSGSDNFNQTFINAMESIGATNLNGTTNSDRTNYFENVPTSMLDYTLFAESDRMGHLLGVLDQKKLDLQRGVVQNEKRQGENQPYGVTEQLLTENTYPVGHPYSWTTIGSMQDLNAATMNDVQTWFKTNYGPNNVVLVLAGDITPQLALEKVEKYYGDIPAGPPLAKQAVWVAKRTGTHRQTVQDRVPQALLDRVWNVPQVGTPEEAQLDLVAQILGGGKTSRLYKRLVYKDQIATRVVAENSSQEIAGQFSLSLTATPGGDLNKVEQTADEVLKEFLSHGPSEEEMRLAKTTILGNYIRIVERIGGFGGKSDLLASCATFTGNPACYKDYLQRVKNATPASVLKAAREWLSDGDYVLEVHPYPVDYATGAALDRSKQPALGHAESLNLPAMQTVTLSNGLKVVLAESHTAPIVNFSLIVNSGFAADTAQMPGVASFAQRMLEEGTPSRDSLKISDELAGLGAVFSTRSNLDSAFVNLNTLKATMRPSLDIFVDLILHPAFPAKEFDRLKKSRLAAVQTEKVTPQMMALRVLPGLLYGPGHPYATPFSGTGTEQALEKMTRGDLIDFHRTWFKPNNATLLVVGDTSLAEIKPQLERLFAGWKGGEVPKKNITTVAQPANTVIYLIDRPDSQQSTIVGAQLAPPKNDHEAIQMDLINDIFGGSFSSRINMNLREDKHWSYGVTSFMRDAAGQRAYLSIAPIQSDKTKEALQQLDMEYRGIIGTKPISPEELADAQTNQTLALPGSFETVGALSENYGQILQYSLPNDYFNTFTKKVMSVTKTEANEMVKRMILPDHLIWIVVGDMKSIEPGIRELNLGEIRKIDADGNPVK